MAKKTADKRGIRNGAGKKTALGGQARALAVEARHVKFRAALKMNGGNATQAAIEAGYSPATAKVQGSQLLSRLNLRRETEAKEREIVEYVGLTLESTLERLRRIVEFDPRTLYGKDGELLPIHDLPEEVATVIRKIKSEEVRAGGRVVGVTREVDTHSQLDAIDKAMKFFGAYERDNQQRRENLAIQINLHPIDRRRS